MTPLWPRKVEEKIRAEAYNADPQQTPAEVRMCTRCVMTNQRPRIVFDDEGVCSACRYAERKAEIDWKARAWEFSRLVRPYEDQVYGAVVPCSGGKDSSTVAHRLWSEYSINPLCAKWAPFLYTDIGRRNFDNFVQSGFDTVVCHPNGLIHRKLARLALEFYGDPFQPFVYGQLAWPMNLAAKFGINLVIYGENGEAEYGGDPSANDKPCWDRDDWDRVYNKGRAFRDLVEIGRQYGTLTEQEIRRLSPFYRTPPDLSDETEFHWFGYYHRWHPQENFYYASEHTGFEANDERSEGTYSKYASLDDKLDGLHYYMSYVKFGIGRCTSDAAHEIRDGDLNRDEALALVKKYDGEFPEKYLPECLDYLDMDRAQLERVIERFRHADVPAHSAA